MTPPLRRAAAATSALALVAAALAVLGGWIHVVVTEGVSMRPLYTQGDLIVTLRSQQYEVGDVVAYHGGTGGLVVLHRIIGGTPAGWVIKGDNNESVDPRHPASTAVLGRAVLHVPRGGLVLHRLTSPAALAVEALVLVLGGGAATGRRRGRRRPRHGRTTAPGGLPPATPAPPGAPPTSTADASASRRERPAPGLLALGSLPPPLRTPGVVAAVVGVLGLGLGALAWTSPTAQDRSVSTTTTRSMAFSWTAVVPPSAAYDGTVVRSPQPVFRRLAATVDVRYRYTGAAGTLTTSLVLRSSDGWVSTQVLTGPERVPAGTHAGVVTLDLDALQARADAAAAAIGSPAGAVGVVVAPRVVTTTGAAFTPVLSLSMTPTALVLAPGGQLTTTQSPARARSITERASLHLGPLAVPVTTARGAAALLLALSLAAGGALLVGARRSAPTPEGDLLRRRYAAHVVEVTALPPGALRTRVDVPTMGALVALATRYSLAVLHPPRAPGGEVDEFVVLDADVTYCYRTRGTSGEGEGGSVGEAVAEVVDAAGAGGPGARAVPAPAGRAERQRGAHAGADEPWESPPVPVRQRSWAQAPTQAPMQREVRERSWEQVSEDRARQERQLQEHRELATRLWAAGRATP